MSQIVTKTLAEIYFKQGHLEEAYEIYKTLSGKDPSDPEIQKRLKELKARLGPPPMAPHPSFRSPEERTRFLNRWLANIRKRRRG